MGEGSLMTVNQSLEEEDFPRNSSHLKGPQVKRRKFADGPVFYGTSERIKGRK